MKVEERLPVRRAGTIEERVVILETVQDRLVELAEGSDRRLDRLERVIWQGVGALGVIIVAVNLVGPIILQRLGVTPV